MGSDRRPPAATFQELILRLQNFWASQGCIIAQPFDVEKGAGTYSPHTFLRALGPEPWKVAYVEPSRRPTDGRFGENPNRLYRHHQFQVILKPSPDHMQELYLDSMREIGIHPEEHDIRFVEDNWASPTLGAAGLGWEVWVDGMEATQFTYFQQCGGEECRPVSGELTYGLERIAMYLQNVNNVYDLKYAPGFSYREVFHQDEVQYSAFALKTLDVPMYLATYEACEKEVRRLLDAELVVPAYDHLLKAAHAFNSLDAAGAISVTERQGYIKRIRDLAMSSAKAYLALRERLNFPLLQGDQTTDLSTDILPSSQTSLEGEPKTAELILELGSEELPAGEVERSLSWLQDKLQKALDELGLSPAKIETYGTPRRLCLVVSGLADRQVDQQVTEFGPPVKAAFKDGAPTKAALGFAKRFGLAPEALTQGPQPGKKGEYLIAKVERKGKATHSLLRSVIEELLAKLPFKNKMRWGTGVQEYSRPLLWIVALFDGRVVPVQYAGVTAGRESRGHRFLSPAQFRVESGAQYVEALAQRSVMVQIEARKQLVIEGAKKAAASVGGVIAEDSDLIDEITQLVEYPKPLLGSFDAEFLKIPKQVLISEMQNHQRYIPVVDGKTGALLPHFVVVAGTEVEDEATSLEGYRRVISARFADGGFFLKEDRETSLFSKVELLSQAVFQGDLGTQRERVDRVAKVAFWLAGALGGQLDVAGAPESSGFGASSDLYALASQKMPESGEARFSWTLARASYLAKADLNTKMVYEFPELQGEMGEEYARFDGEPREVATAISEHYLPRGKGDDFPSGGIGALVGLADRMHSIVALWAVGQKPKGGADFFAQRRAALAVIQLLLHFKWHVSLSGMVEEVLALVEAKRAAFGEKQQRAKRKKPVRTADEVRAEVLAFFADRMLGVLTEQGVPTDVAQAVLAAGSDDVVDALGRGLALAKLAKSKQDFEPVAVTFKRAANILKQAKEKGFEVGPLDPALLRDDAEKVLLEKAVGVEARVAEAIAGRDFMVGIHAIADLRPVFDRFFDDVMVMVEGDDALRGTRLGLIGKVHEIFAPLADFTKIHTK